MVAFTTLPFLLPFDMCDEYVPETLDDRPIPSASARPLPVDDEYVPGIIDDQPHVELKAPTWDKQQSLNDVPCAFDSQAVNTHPIYTASVHDEYVSGIIDSRQNVTASTMDQPMKSNDVVSAPQPAHTTHSARRKRPSATQGDYFPDRFVPRHNPTAHFRLTRRQIDAACEDPWANLPLR